MDKNSQTVRHRRLSSELKKMREAAGITVERAARALGSNRTKIHRIERGEWKRLKEEDIRTLSVLYGVTDPQRQEALIDLARQAKSKGWWARYSDVLGPGTYVSLEASASSFRFYGGLMVPGLLQTAGYTKAITRGSGVTDRSEIKRRVEARLKRQEILEKEDRPQVQAVVDEAALVKLVGNHIVMQEQLLRLMLLNDEEVADIRVLPNSAGAHMAMTGQFVILDFISDPPASVIFIDISREGLFLEEPADINRYTMMFDSLWNMALPQEKSQEVMARMVDKLTRRK